jgi:hypothetical protein
MLSPSREYPESRPFKIFLSMLDKWEIGAPLTQVLAYDAFKAIKSLVENPSEGSEDVSSCFISSTEYPLSSSIGDYDGKHTL